MLAAEAKAPLIAWRRIVWVLALLVGAALLAAKMSFLCDDAFITFRHVSNAMDGHGLVWNAPPFHPVEGYTGFSWAMLLWVVWAVFGVEPPAAANVLSTAFGLAQLALAAVAVFRLRRRDGTPVAASVAIVALLVLATERTFLQWFTSGLETALFNLAFVLWVLLAFRAPASRTTGWLAGWSAAAALAALTRPDGLLLVAATGAVAALDVLRHGRRLASLAAGLAPLAAVLAHLLWRRWFYGDWLPNTYYAKVTAPWPQAGWRYLWCFSFEHGLWWWGLLASAWLAVTAARVRAACRMLAANVPALAAVGAVLVHVGWYTLRIGGDHFEYRVYSQLIPLLVLSAAAMSLQLAQRAWLPLVALAGLGVAGVPGWLHWALVEPTLAPAYVPLASKLPAWLRPLVREYDRNQAWLHLQFVCMRCSAHQMALTGIVGGMPPRARHAADAADVPVVQSVAVGLVAWVLPDIAVIDLLGLCDRVIARSPLPAWNFPLPRDVLHAAIASADADRDGFCTIDELTRALVTVGTPAEAAHHVADLMVLLFARAREDGLTSDEAASFEAFCAQLRWMAHERRAPPEYVEALDPDVTIENRQVVVRKRTVPLTAERVRAIEAEWWLRVSAPLPR